MAVALTGVAGSASAARVADAASRRTLALASWIPDRAARGRKPAAPPPSLRVARSLQLPSERESQSLRTTNTTGTFLHRQRSRFVSGVTAPCRLQRSDILGQAFIRRMWDFSECVIVIVIVIVTCAGGTLSSLNLTFLLFPKVHVQTQRHNEIH